MIDPGTCGYHWTDTSGQGHFCNIGHDHTGQGRPSHECRCGRWMTPGVTRLYGDPVPTPKTEPEEITLDAHEIKALRKLVEDALRAPEFNDYRRLSVREAAKLLNERLP